MTNLYHRPEMMGSALLRHRGFPSVSIYIPTHRRGAEVEQDPIRLGNQIAAAEADLGSQGMKPRAIDAVLEDARSLRNDYEFWQHGTGGLALLIDEHGDTSTVRLPESCQERTVVADTFHVRPILEQRDSPEVDVLVLTLGGVALYQMENGRLERIEADLPSSFADVNWFVDREPQSQQRAGSRGGRGVHHGHEVVRREDADVDRFFRAIEQVVSKGDHRKSLVVLGVDDLAMRYIKETSRTAVSPDHSGIGDPDDIETVEELIRPVLQEMDAKRRQQVEETARADLGKGSALTEIDECLEAAITGRVESLTMRSDADPVWGRLDLDSLKIEHVGAHEIGTVDLLDRLVAHAAMTGAHLHFLPDTVEGHTVIVDPRY